MYSLRVYLFKNEIDEKKKESNVLSINFFHFTVFFLYEPTYGNNKNSGAKTASHQQKERAESSVSILNFLTSYLTVVVTLCVCA